MGVPVSELQSTMAPTTDYCLSHLYSDWASNTFFCRGQKHEYLSRALPRSVQIIMRFSLVLKSPDFYED